MCFGIRLFNLEFFVLEALIEDIQQMFISGAQDQLIKHVEFCDTDIIKATVDVIIFVIMSYFRCLLSGRMVGIISFLQDIALEWKWQYIQGHKICSLYDWSK